MKKITTFLAILMFAAEALVMAQQPDAEYKLLSRKYEIKSDGNMVYNFRKELKLNSQRSFFSIYGESFIVYNPEFQTLKINEAYTLRADGSRVDAPKNAFVEQLPSACADCGYYNAFREMVVVHTALEKGATIVLDYTITSKPGVLLDKIVFAEDAPVTKYVVSVKVPSARDLNYAVKNPSSKVALKQAGSQFTWTGTNLPQTTAEPYAPAADKLYPVLYLTTMDNLDNMLPTDFSLPTTAGDFVADLGGEELDKAKKINEHVIRNMRLNNVSLAQTGLRFRNASEVWNANCGNAFEKTLLLNGLLQLAGFQSKVAFRYDTLKCNGKDFYFPLSEYVTFDWQDQKYELSATHAGKLEPVGKSLNTKLVSVDDNYILTAEGKTLKCSGKKGDVELHQLAEGYYSLTLERPLGVFSMMPGLLVGKRTAPLVCGTAKEVYRYTVILPKNVRWVGKPIDVTVNKPFGYMQIKMVQTDNKLEVVRSLSLTQSEIPVAQYNDFKAMLLKWTDENYKRLVFAVEN